MNENEVEEYFAEVIDDENLSKLIEIKSKLENLFNKMNERNETKIKFKHLLNEVDDLIENW